MRARNIKPGFFRNECLADCDPLSRLLFAGLWCVADKSGKFEWRPRRIKADLLPYDDCEIDKLLGDLVRCGFIEYYAANGIEYGRILNFDKHQKPHHTEKESVLPDPNPDDNDTVTVKYPLRDRGNRPDSLIPDSLIPYKHTVEQKRSTAPFSEIISHLNETASRNFSLKTKSTLSLIKARWNEGRTLEDFKRVHEIKWEEWKSDDEMMKFYRPETLYSAKHFESYLNQKAPEDERNARRERLRRKHGKDI